MKYLGSFFLVYIMIWLVLLGYLYLLVQKFRRLRARIMEAEDKGQD